MSNLSLYFTNNLYNYLQKHSLREPLILQQLREQTQKMSTRKMQILPEQGQFIQLLIELIQAKNTLEIGVFTGYSTLAVALALPVDGKITACDINVEWTKIAKKFWKLAGVADKIDLRIAPALDTLQTLLKQGQAGTFDFIFIDADKKNYSIYYEKSLELIRVGGLILIDNVLWGGDVVNPQVNDENTLAIRELNSQLVNDERITLSMLPLGDGMTLACKRK